MYPNAQPVNAVPERANLSTVSVSGWTVAWIVQVDQCICKDLWEGESEVGESSQRKMTKEGAVVGRCGGCVV